ncbi:MAG: hypothetical protein GX190_03205 [Mollicutes bacterium]|nr:hypothetical protein [Mollicutes bacterium]
MKRLEIIIGICIIVFLVAACSMNDMNNTPTKQVEIFFKKYQMLDESVLNDLNRVVAEEEQFNNEQREKYKDIMKKHYQNLIYNIKDEEVNGDIAIVSVEIEVTDYSRILREAELYLQQNPEEFQTEDGEFDIQKYSEYRLNKLEDASETVKYTLDIGLTRIDEEWKVNQISEIDEEKIHGVYEY